VLTGIAFTNAQLTVQVHIIKLSK